MKKIICLVLSVLIGVCCFSACAGRNNNNITIDADRSQLYVGFFKAGFGETWFDEAVREFEEYHAKTKYEEGKEGVQIIPQKETERFAIGALQENMQHYSNVVYILDQFDFDLYRSKGLLADITDIVTEDVYDVDGNFAKDTGKEASKSMVDFYYDGYAESSSVNGVHYTIPYRYSVDGIIYDADMFNERGFYFYADGEIGAQQSDIDEDVDGSIVSLGPDGIANTEDDGMPRTWKEFVKLLDEMVDTDGVTPFTWGDTNYQKWKAFIQVVANYEGANDFWLNYTFNGTDSQFGKIDETNYTKLLEQNGRKAAIKAFKDIASNSDYYSVNAESQTYDRALYEFIKSKNSANEIAMFFDGGYWESEGRKYFDTMPNGFKYGQRDYRLLPIPNFVDETDVPNQDKANNDRVIFGYGSQSAICISAKNNATNLDVQLKIAKDFLQFIQRRDQLVDFTKNTGGGFRLSSFTATEAEVSSFTKFGQSIYRQMKEDGATTLTNLDVSQIRKAAPSSFAENKWFFAIGNIVDPISYVLKNSTFTVEQIYANNLGSLTQIFE